MQGLGGAISDAQDAQLRSAVSMADPVDFLRELDSEIRDYLDLREWRLALIESAVAFEAFVKRYLRERYSRKGLGAPQIEAKFLREDGPPRSVTSLAKKAVQDATGFDFAGATEYRNWEMLVRDPRNELIHGTRFNVSREEAIAAYDAMKAAIRILQAH